MRVNTLKIRRHSRIILDEIGRLGPDTILYVNFPFCKSFCRFCIYKIHLYKSGSCREFFDSYEKEISLYRASLGHFRFRQVHIGGGTPNLAAPNRLLEPLRPLVDFKRRERLIVEVLPRPDLPAYLKALEKFRPTKIQLGAQTLSDPLLRSENRSSSKKVILENCAYLRSSGLNWSVDLIYGLAGEKRAGRDYQKELLRILSFAPAGVHFYDLRSQTGNDFYDKGANPRYRIYPKNTDLKTLESIMRRRGYVKVYDEWCRGGNVEHAKLSVCYNEKSGAFPDILGLGPAAKTHLRRLLTTNYKELGLYSRLTSQGVIPVDRFYYFRGTGLYPVLNIYTGIKRISRFDIKKFKARNSLDRIEQAEITRLIATLRRENLKPRLEKGALVIPAKSFTRALYLLEEYMWANRLKS